jgi:hypothetical protein
MFNKNFNALFSSDCLTAIQHFDWLCHWVYTPRDDQRAKCLLLMRKFIYPHVAAEVVERIKKV